MIANYVRLGRWAWCYHCRAIIQQEALHYCGAPWQTRASDIPADWIPAPTFTREDVAHLRYVADDFIGGRNAETNGLRSIADRMETLFRPEDK